MRLTTCILASVLLSCVSRAQTGGGVPVFQITPVESSIKFDVEASVDIKGKFDKWDASLTFKSPDVRRFIGCRRSGFLFQTANGLMFDPGNVARDSLRPILKDMGRAQQGARFNMFRRFREAVLQRSEARQILIDYWMGHASASMGDRYGRQLVEDIEYRQEQVKNVGLGFEPPPALFGLRGLQIVEESQAA